MKRASEGAFPYSHVLSGQPTWIQGRALTEERKQMDESTIDREAMGQLANALTFICGADHPTVAAMRKAVASGTDRDIKNARAQFLKLKASDRRAALAMLKD